MTLRRNGLRLDDERIAFNFDGRRIDALRGDSAASALLANGVRLLARSIKYHRPRGILTAGIEEPNALLTVGPTRLAIPNVPAPILQVSDALEVRSQNRWPTLQWDAGALLGLGGGMLGAGFYYKTFMWPSWRSYEGVIRHLAGLGRPPLASNLPNVDIEHLSTDVLIAGGGPAGLAAALAAARSGARVVLCEREPMCGGELDFESAIIDGHSALPWIGASLRELQQRGARILTDTAVIGGADGLLVALRQQGGLPGDDVLYRIRARAFIAATGAIEQPIAFVNNDLPGVMLLGAAERYLARYGVRVGSTPVLFGNHDRLYETAARLLGHGIRVRAIVDTRSESEATSSATLRNELRQASVECLTGHAVLAADGWRRVESARVAPLNRPDAAHIVGCDALLVSGGWSHVIRPEWRMTCGAAAGHLTIDTAIHNAHAVGLHAGAAASNVSSAPRARGDAAPNLIPFFRSPCQRSDEKRQFVDLQNDVTVADLRQALDEGFTNIEHVKRYTTLGVGTEQGRTSAALGAAILAELSNKPLGTIGPTRARPPFQPVTMMSLCGLRTGMNLRPARHTPLHACHQQQGAVLELMGGGWMRPRFYSGNGTDAERAGLTEASRVRQHGGIADSSTLGKIEVAGTDAAAFLDRLYLAPASTIPIGRCRYMVNLREDGMVLEDGIVARLASDHFLATFSSATADHMMSHFEFWRDLEFSERAVAITDVTEAWAVIAVAGPQSRATLHAVLGTQWHETLGSLGHMRFVAGRWQSASLRVLRTSFSGDLAYELHCQPSIAPMLWQTLSAAGLQPYGMEALDVLRIEKGYLGGAELNGQNSPFDLDMQGMVALRNPCIGRELLRRAAFQEPQRPQLVGVQAIDARTPFLSGAQITLPGTQSRPIGYVTSATYSPALGKYIGLAMVAGHEARNGKQLLACDPLRGRETLLVIVPRAHFDPAGERMKA